MTMPEQEIKPKDKLRGLFGLPGAIRDVFALGLAGLAVRLAWVLWGAWTSGDTPEYLTMAKNIAFHHVFSLSDAAAGALVPTTHRPPLYPALIAAFWWGDAPPVNLVLIVQAVLGTLTVILVYLIARDRFSRKVALIAGIGMALAPLSSRYTAVIMTETLFVFLVTLGLFLWGRKQYLWTGVAFGLSMLTRPTMMPFLLILAALPLLPAWRKEWRAYLMILLMAVAVSSVWIIRNAVVFGRFIPIAASGYGTNLLFGTIETKLVNDDVWTSAMQDPALSVGEGMNESDADRAKMMEAFRRIKADPLHWLVVRAKQYPRLFMDSGDYLLGSRNVPIGQALRERHIFVLLTKIVFLLGTLLLFALAAFGLFMERARFVSLAHITLFPVFLTLIHLPLWVGDSRYSLPMIPPVAILAALALARLADAVKDRMKRKALLTERQVPA